MDKCRILSFCRARGQCSSHIALLVLLSALAGTAGAEIDPVQRTAIQTSQKVGEAVLDALESDGIASVIVAYDLPPALVAPRSLDFDTQSAAAWRAAIKAEGDRLTGRVLGAGGEVIERYQSARALSARVSVDTVIELLADPGVWRIDLEGQMRPAMNQARPFTGIDRTNALGFTGSGVTVAILDTGFMRSHTDLSDDIVEEQCFCTWFSGGCCPNGTARQSGPGSAPEHPGQAHGTFMAGIVTGRGTAAPRGGAPDADVLAIKVLGPNGDGTNTGIIAALDWVLNSRPNVSVVNMSIVGTLVESESSCDEYNADTRAMADIIYELRRRGTVVVASSGNNHTVGAMTEPACIGGVISVAASYDDDSQNASFPDCPDDSRAPDTVACFSDVNSTTDMVAPGVNISSTFVNGYGAIASGTSEAAAITSACAALIKQAAPLATATEVEQALEGVPEIVDHRTLNGAYGSNGLRLPRLNCEASISGVLGGSGLCPAVARAGCRRPTEAGAGSLYLKNYVTSETKDYWRWYWKKGQSTGVGEFSDPTSASSYFSVCVYDRGGARRLMNMFVPGGGTCAGNPCWRPYSLGGWRYKDPLRSPSGIESITMRPGASGLAAITVIGRGPNLRASLPPFEAPARAQIINHSNNLCWEASFSGPSTNGGTSSSIRYFKARND